MDFLDPRLRRTRHIRLMVGYFLMAIAIGLATIILVYGANGYGINTKTGQIIQNGLLFVGSQPSGAEVYLNGQDQHATSSARLVIPSGDYTLSLKKAGYRDWQRSLTLEEHSIDRFVYPFLFPVTPRVSNLASYSGMPGLVTESPDQHWLLVERDGGSSTGSFDKYDTTDLTKQAQIVSVPADLLSGTQDASSSFSVVEWSTDNKNVLLKHVYNGGDEYIVFDHDKPEDSFNVNRVFGVNPSEVALFNKKVSQLYIYNQADQTLQLGDVGKASLADPLLKQVLAFKPNGTDLISYITDRDMASGNVQARIWDSGQTYPLDNLKSGNTYLIDAAQYSGHWYYIAGSDTEGRVNIYQDPLSDIKSSSIHKALPTLALNVPGATKASFSTNARFIEVENGQAFGVYDMETQVNYQYRLKPALAGPLGWMDGHRLIGESSGQIFVTDYDSTNQQSITATADPTGGLFSKDFNHLLTIQAKSDGSFELVNVDMRAGADLPKL